MSGAPQRRRCRSPLLRRADVHPRRQVAGTVTVDSSCTITVSDFTYDGQAPAAYWWCAASDSQADMAAGFEASPERLLRPYNGEQVGRH